MTHILIPSHEVLAELEQITACQACRGGSALVVELDGDEAGEWYAAALHTDECSPAPMPPRTLRLVDLAHDVRCRSCGGLLQADIGGGNDGEVELYDACMNCQPRPTTFGGAA